MAIVFDCPHCKTTYRLKDEFAGKTATCKNPSCRKVIPIPKLVGAGTSSKPVDVDAIAAAAFSDEAVVHQDAGPGEMLPVTCIGCDHTWSVEAAKEGKNVLCPECRKSNRVPPRKKVEKADWRGGPNKPSLAKVDMGLDRKGASTTADMGGISQQTAQQIMKERDAVEEPEVRRKKLIKRGTIGLVVLLTMSAGIYYAVKKRGESRADASMADAVKELVEGKDAKDPRYISLIRRASAEYQIRGSKNGAETKDALKELQLARNTAKPIKGHDLNGILSEVAVTTVELLGTTEQVDQEQRLPKDLVLKELRQAVQAMSDGEATADTLRAITRKCAEKEQPTVAQDVARQLPNPNEMLGQVGLELLRIDREKYRSEAEKILGGASAAVEPAMQALRIVLGKAAAKKEAIKEAAQSVSWIASAEASALKGEFAKIKTSVAYANIAERVKALAAAGHAGIEKNPAEVTPLIEEAAKLLIGEAKGNPAISPWVGVRVCRLLGKLGKFDVGESVAKSLPDEQIQAWAQLEVFRGKLSQAKGKKEKADDAWLDVIGNASTIAAAAKAREEIARHNAAAGENYSANVKSWEKGKVRPFGMAGIVLGNQDLNLDRK